ncbi:hypothetical protein T02_15852 [Trichinella nativa]|uniref:Uncharacterized protein n=1 Tax=Trichinella nativa TaxID=6335 RepID=A0A0V1KK85_9BILA|nr:hypothetical protein T02_15852 [Trichinella nativa]
MASVLSPNVALDNMNGFELTKLFEHKRLKSGPC